MTQYRIKRDAIWNDSFYNDSIILEFSSSLEEINIKIKDYAESWKSESNLIQHHAGQSVVYYDNHRVEYTRIPNITNIN